MVANVARVFSKLVMMSDLRCIHRCS